MTTISLRFACIATSVSEKLLHNSCDCDAAASFGRFCITRETGPFCQPAAQHGTTLHSASTPSAGDVPDKQQAVKH